MNCQIQLVPACRSVARQIGAEFALIAGMRYETIVKTERDLQIAPNLPNYEQARAAFSWEQARTQLAGLPGGHGVNIAHEAIDRHASGQRGNQVALRWLGKTGQARNYTYHELRNLTNRFSNVLQSLGIGVKDRVFVLAGRVPELYIAALGTLKNRSVFCPLFSAFGPEPPWIWARSLLRRATILQLSLPTPRIGPSCISPVGQPARRKGRCMSTARCSRIILRDNSRSTCIPVSNTLAVNTQAAVVSESRLTSHSIDSLRFQEQLELP